MGCALFFLGCFLFMATPGMLGSGTGSPDKLSSASPDRFSTAVTPHIEDVPWGAADTFADAGRITLGVAIFSNPKSVSRLVGGAGELEP